MIKNAYIVAILCVYPVSTILIFLICWIAYLGSLSVLLHGWQPYNLVQLFHTILLALRNPLKSDNTTLNFIFFWVTLTGWVSFGSVFTVPYKVWHLLRIKLGNAHIIRGRPFYQGYLLSSRLVMDLGDCTVHCEVFETRIEPTTIQVTLEQTFNPFVTWFHLYIWMRLRW